MNILIPESWLRDHLKTQADIKEIAKILSLTSVSVERINKHGSENVLDIEVTTNRVDLMSIEGIAKEATASLNENNIPATFVPVKLNELTNSNKKLPIEIDSDPSIVNRICAVVMSVNVKNSPKTITDQLEASGIRSLNNLIDVTNYVMRELGHPTHVFDLDRLNTKALKIRKSKKGEEIETLDGKNHVLLGDDIIAEDDQGRIVDLLGVMGTQNSVVTSETKNILFFIDNNNPVNIRNTSMNLGIRTEAAIINEKGVDPNLSIKALKRGIKLFEEIADGKISSEILDIYPNKPKEIKVLVSMKKINETIGVEISKKEAEDILKSLGFEVSFSQDDLIVKIPSIRGDIQIEEDIIEEIARIYGYHKLPSIIPTFFNNKAYRFDNSFYFENRIKQAFKYLGFTEVYTYSTVSEEILEGPIENALAIKNPLSDDMVYLRVSLTPSLLSVISENKKETNVKIFELANVYEKQKNDLPKEVLTLSGAIKRQKNNFYEVKGVIEAVLGDIGAMNLKYKTLEEGVGAQVFKGNENLGKIEVFDDETITFEFNFEKIIQLANIKKVYKPIAKFPPIIEDLSVEVSEGINTIDVINEIKLQSDLITEVSLLDQFGSKKTFHIIYQALDRSLKSSEITKVRQQIIDSLTSKFSAKIP